MRIESKSKSQGRAEIGLYKVIVVVVSVAVIVGSQISRQTNSC